MARFSYKGREWKIFCCRLALSAEPQRGENFVSSFGRLRQKLHQKACRMCSTIIFSSFNQSRYWFVTLSSLLPSSFLKLPNGSWRRRRWKRECHLKMNPRVAGIISRLIQVIWPARYTMTYKGTYEFFHRKLISCDRKFIICNDKNSHVTDEPP